MPASDIVTRAIGAYVRRSSDAQLERTLGSRRGLRRVFGAMTARLDPEAAAGFAGAIGYDLHRADGTREPWTVAIAGGRATAAPGRAADPAVTVTVGVGDFLRIALRQADADRLLLDGRLDLSGDWAVASRLGAMFGRPEGR